MVQTSDCYGCSELFEINKTGLIEFLHRQEELLHVFEQTREKMNSIHEKLLITNAKQEIKSLLDEITTIQEGNDLTEFECETKMKKIYGAIKNIHEFVDFEYLN